METEKYKKGYCKTKISAWKTPYQCGNLKVSEML